MMMMATSTSVEKSLLKDEPPKKPGGRLVKVLVASSLALLLCLLSPLFRERRAVGVYFFSPRRNFCAEKTKVVSSAGFPSYCDFERTLRVSYDGLSLKLNDARALILSGSIHMPRLTKGSWDRVLDLAVEQGLNAVQIYVFWNYHFIKNKPLDFKNEKDVATLIEKAGARGLFVTLRVGPYVCGEWTYGGLPTALGFEESIIFRTYNEKWMEAMGNFTKEVIEYMKSRHLWASQGGPIILAQIENELSINDDDPVRGKKYVDWCGNLTRQFFETGAAWLMCNGETAEGLINSCNGQNCDNFLETNGQNGKVLVSQPGLWTELEEGYQLWGESATSPSDYFWGTNARTTTTNALRWFARGGSHLNYYMWAGASNFANFAAAGITQAYSVNAALCSNLQKHQPKYDHLQRFHKALVEIAPFLLERHFETTQNHNVYRFYEHKNDTDFVFAIIENNNDEIIYLSSECSVKTTGVAIVRSDCSVLFDSEKVSQESQAYRRRDSHKVARFSDWAFYPLNLSSSPSTITALLPVEQSELLLFSDEKYQQYATYATKIENLKPGRHFLRVVTSKANGLILFVNGIFADATDDHQHAEGNVTLTLNFETQKTNNSLVLVSENFGIHNLIGRWGASRSRKRIGIVGPVTLDDSLALLHWRSTPGLQRSSMKTTTGRPCIFSEASFDLLRPLQKSQGGAFVLDALSLGRGHLYINGHDLGRF